MTRGLMQFDLRRAIAPAIIVACAGALLAAVVSSAGAVAADPARPAIDYNRQIRPILSNNCFKCHGPDDGARESGLRLDQRDAALKPAESGKRAIVPGKPAESRLVERVFAIDPSDIMPPPEENKKLSDAEKELLREWIAQGANYQQHWAFVTPARPAVPAVKSKSWARNAIDEFILARLEAEGLAPAAEADRTTLIRRVTLDLTGLPPTPAEVDAFLADKGADAYEKVVDRLLDSPHYGERMALDWLDASRFADTHGYHIDSGRDMTRWREWVISAFNGNKPFDRFTIEQLAGDLLPDATREQKIASGFNRNHMINFEGGAIPEEYHTAYIVDRVNTTGTVWLGLTIGCAQCHDHKYDPISQKEFYQLFAFFYNVPENGLDGTKGNAAPLLKVPTEEQQKRLDQMATEIATIEQKLAAPWPEIDAAQSDWEKTALAESQLEWTTLIPMESRSQGGATLTALDDRSLLASGTNPATESYTVVARMPAGRFTGLKIEALPDESFPARGPGRSSNGNLVLTDVRVATGAAGRPAGDATAVKLASASADFSQKDFPVANAIDGDAKSGWAILPEVGKPHFAVVQFAEPIAAGDDSTLIVTLDFQSQFSQHQIGRLRLSVTTAKDPHGTKRLPEGVAKSLALATDQRNAEQKAELRHYYRTQVSAEAAKFAGPLTDLRQMQAELDKTIPTTMVMQEMEKPRDTFMLIRGQYDKKGEKVAAGVPAAFPPLPKDAPGNRLGLAQWLVSPSHPLTARVAVNRYWQMFFGTGLVKTSEDFGSQGELPSHPQLLDWLAVEFSTGKSASGAAAARSATPPAPPLQRGGGGPWNVKALIRLIVTSATYRQSSVVTKELYTKDPENRLLARGPRFRLQAEFIRDQALATSGLLNRKIGGHSVSPYQPAGLWEELMSRADGKNWTAQSYEQSHGDDLYRRTMYTFWKRTCPPPTLATFDAPDRETCTVRRARTNTPLQALVLLNDPTYVEASRKLAERMLSEAGNSADERITFAFRLATARKPTAKELAVLRQIADDQLARFRRDKSAAEKLLSVGESPRNEALDASELAAWTTVASVILNLDETLTRG